MKKIVIKGRVIDATGSEPIENGVVVLEGNKIVEVGPNETVDIPNEAELIEIEEGTIMPGFIDAHAHFGVGTVDASKLYSETAELKVCRAISEMSVVLDSGFTTIREVGGFANKMKEPLDKGLIRGPRISASGAMISSVGGHGDIYQKFPEEMVPLTRFGAIADGVEELRKMCRKQFRDNADFIKICTTGGSASQGDSNNAITYSMDEIKACVEEARNHGSYVAVHAHGTKGIKDALKAGVRTIEHGIFLDDECIELMVRNNAYLLPTYTIGQVWIDNIDIVPEWLRETVEGMTKALGGNPLEFFAKGAKKALKAGVKLGLGSDLLGDPVAGPFGKNGMEFELLTKYAGLTPMESILAGTKINSEILRMEDKIGTLEKGKLADVVVVKGNPLEDIKLLGEPNNIKVVIKDGKIEKQIA